MGKIADKLASRVQTLSGASESSGAAASTADDGAAEDVQEVEASSSEESTATEAPVETIETATGEAPAEPVEDENALRKRLLSEKIEAARERRRAHAEDRARRASESRSQAQIDADLEAARAEREKWQRLGKGNFKDVLKELGRDPLKTYEEMEREAAEANTPEGQIRRLQEKYETTIAELSKKIDDLVEEQTQERRRSQDQEVISRFEGDFARQLQDPAYRVLRVAYEDDELLAFAHGYREDPKRMYAAAESLGVRLTNPQKGFTMREILTVLKAAQEAYDGKRKAREQKLSGESGGQRDRSRVNGASAPEAVSTIGTDLASTRASGERRKLTRQERIDAEIDRLARHR